MATVLDLSFPAFEPNDLEQVVEQGLELKSRVKQLEEENDRLREGLPAASSGAVTRQAALEEQLRLLRDENAVLRRSASGGNAAQQLADDLRAVRQENVELAAEVRALRMQVRYPGKRVNELTRDNQELGRELGQALQFVAELEQQVEDLTAERDALVADLAAARTRTPAPEPEQEEEEDPNTSDLSTVDPEESSSSSADDLQEAVDRAQQAVDDAGEVAAEAARRLEEATKAVDAATRAFYDTPANDQGLRTGARARINAARAERIRADEAVTDAERLLRNAKRDLRAAQRAQRLALASQIGGSFQDEKYDDDDDAGWAARAEAASAAMEVYGAVLAQETMLAQQSEDGLPPTVAVEATEEAWNAYCTVAHGGD